MNIVKTNHFSKMHNLYDNATKTDEDYFKHRVDNNLPNFGFRRIDTTPNQIKTKYEDIKARFTLKQAGFLGKMFIRHTFKYGDEELAQDAVDNLSTEVGSWLVKRVRLMQQEKEIEEISPVIISHRINTQSNNEEINLQQSLKAVLNEDGVSVTFYSPLLFSTGSDVNHMLDTKFLQSLTLELECENYHKLGLDFAEAHDMELLCHYMTIDDYEGYAMKFYKKPQYLPIENSGIIGGAPRKVIGDTVNNIQIDNRDLVKLFILSVYDDEDTDKEGKPIKNVKITSNNEEIYRAKSGLESLLFNNNYRGLVSHRISDSTNPGLVEAPFDIPAYKNGFSGGLNMDKLYKDCSISFFVDNSIASSDDIKAVVGYLYYDMLKINTDGTIEKAEVNNTPFLDEYDYSTEPTKPELPKKEAPPAKVSL